VNAVGAFGDVEYAGDVHWGNDFFGGVDCVQI
jgi:hypothetical protein